MSSLSILLKLFNFIYVYIIYVIIYPILYIPFALYNRLRNKPSSYSHDITKKLMNYFHSDIIYLTDNKVIDSGFILANHRCSFDFIFDPHIGRASIIGRYKAVLSTFFLSILGIIERRIIPMQKTFGRNYVFDLVKNHIEYSYIDFDDTFNKRIVFYPEGSRLNYMKLDNIDDIKNILKPGLLKSIYEYNKKPVQIIITKNKEKVYNEFNIDVNFNVKLSIHISDKIYPSEYNNFGEFYEHICKEWFEIFNKVYDENLIK